VGYDISPLKRVKFYDISPLKRVKFKKNLTLESGEIS
jgi:hypothetical protein